MANEILKTCLEKGFLLDKEMLNFFSKIDKETANDIVYFISGLKMQERVVTRGFFMKNSEKFADFAAKFQENGAVRDFFVDLGCIKTNLENKKISKSDENYIKILSS